MPGAGCSAMFPSLVLHRYGSASAGPFSYPDSGFARGYRAVAFRRRLRP